MASSSRNTRSSSRSGNQVAALSSSQQESTSLAVFGSGTASPIMRGDTVPAATVQAHALAMQPGHTVAADAPVRLLTDAPPIWYNSIRVGSKQTLSSDPCQFQFEISRAFMEAVLQQSRDIELAAERAAGATAASSSGGRYQSRRRAAGASRGRERAASSFAAAYALSASSSSSLGSVEPDIPSRATLSRALELTGAMTTEILYFDGRLPMVYAVEHDELSTITPPTTQVDGVSWKRSAGCFHMTVGVARRMVPLSSAHGDQPFILAFRFAAPGLPHVVCRTRSFTVLRKQNTHSAAPKKVHPNAFVPLTRTRDGSLRDMQTALLRPRRQGFTVSSAIMMGEVVAMANPKLPDGVTAEEADTDTSSSSPSSSSSSSSAAANAHGGSARSKRGRGTVGSSQSNSKRSNRTSHDVDHDNDDVLEVEAEADDAEVEEAGHSTVSRRRSRNKKYQHEYGDVDDAIEDDEDEDGASGHRSSRGRGSTRARTSHRSAATAATAAGGGGDGDIGTHAAATALAAMASSVGGDSHIDETSGPSAGHTVTQARLRQRQLSAHTRRPAIVFNNSQPHSSSSAAAGPVDISSTAYRQASVSLISVDGGGPSLTPQQQQQHHARSGSSDLGGSHRTGPVMLRRSGSGVAPILPVQHLPGSASIMREAAGRVDSSTAAWHHHQQQQQRRQQGGVVISPSVSGALSGSVHVSGTVLSASSVAPTELDRRDLPSISRAAATGSAPLVNVPSVASDMGSISLNLGLTGSMDEEALIAAAEDVDSLDQTPLTSRSARRTGPPSRHDRRMPPPPQPLSQTRSPSSPASQRSFGGGGIGHSDHLAAPLLPSSQSSTVAASNQTAASAWLLHHSKQSLARRLATMQCMPAVASAMRQVAAASSSLPARSVHPQARVRSASIASSPSGGHSVIMRQPADRAARSASSVAAMEPSPAETAAASASVYATSTAVR